jgi:voltage-gated potassium channel
MIKELGVPHGALIEIIQRGDKTIVPRGDVVIEAGDRLVLCAESTSNDMLEDVKEIILRKNHKWNGLKIKELDLSRQAFIVMVDRGGKMLVPSGELTLQEGDKLLVYSKENLNKYSQEHHF